MGPDVAGQLDHIGRFIAAAGGLGTAAFGLVDASKAFMGGISNAGFSFVRQSITPLLPASAGPAAGVFGAEDILRTLRSNWLNGVAKPDQKAIAKSLIRLCINPNTAPNLATRVGVDGKAFAAVAQKIADGRDLDTDEVGILGRFDAMVSARLDEAYERGDQQYRNTSKLVAGVVAIALALFGGSILYPAAQGYLGSSEMLTALLVGAISTPLAPIAKDVSSSLVAAVKALGG